MAHIQKRGPKRYRVRYRGTDNRERYSRTVSTRREAEDELDAIRKQLSRGVDPTRSKITYRAWADAWVGGAGKAGEARRSNFQSILRRRIYPVLGDRSVGELCDDPTLLVEWCNDLKRAGLSDAYIYDAVSLLMRTLKAAAKAKIVTADRIPDRDLFDVASPGRKRELYLTKAEVEFLIAGATEGVEHFAPRWRAVPYTSVMTGCGWGEVAGLLHENLDLANGTLDVRTVAARTTPGHYVLKQVPKNDYRKRTIELPRQLIHALRVHLIAAPPSEFVFPNTKGGMLTPRNFRRDVWDPALTRSGMDVDFSDLRKTHVAWLIDDGWSEARIVRRMGWKDGRMLHAVYGPRLKKRQRDDVSGLEVGWSEDPILPPTSDDSRPPRGLPDSGRESGAI